MEIKRSLTKLVCVPLQGNAWHLPGALRHTDDSTSLFQISSSERLLNTLLALVLLLVVVLLVLLRIRFSSKCENVS